MGASFQLEFYSWEEIMIAKITLVSMLVAVALARPEADPYFYHHGVVGHVHPTCEQGVDTLEVQSCAPRVDKICNTVDVVSEEITYEKRCKEVVSKTCSPVIVKRSAEAEPEADHHIAKVTCTPGQTTVTDLAATYGLVPAAAPA